MYKYVCVGVGVNDISVERKGLQIMSKFKTNKEKYPFLDSVNNVQRGYLVIRIFHTATNDLLTMVGLIGDLRYFHNFCFEVKCNFYSLLGNHQ